MTIRLLLIDDHTLFRSGLSMVLAAGLGDVEVFEAASVEQALLCPCTELDLLLVDVQLNGLNGLDGIALLQCKWPHAKVLVVSALQSEQVIQTALAKGAQGFLCKAETPAQMLDLVAQILLGEGGGSATPLLTATPAKLTPRQLEVLSLLCQGLPNKMIGRRLNLSENTVRGHVQALLSTLQASSRSEAAFIARQQGLIN